MTLPSPDLWLRSVLDQQYRGSSWSAYETRFIHLLGTGQLFFHAWPVDEWAAADEAVDKNTGLLNMVPAWVKVVCPGNGPDGSLTLAEDLSLSCVGDPTKLPYVLPKGTEMDLEIGNVSPVLTYNKLTMGGAIARFPYDFDDQRVSPHLFILATPYRAELNAYP